MPVMPSQDSLSPAASLIAFCRLPVPGQVKTRLAYSIGADAACEWYSACAQYTVALCSSLPHLASLVVYHSCKDESEDMQQWLGAVGLGSPRVAAQPPTKALVRVLVLSTPQRKGGDLGDKMLEALQQEAQRHPKVIIVGSDVPGLSVAVLEAAVRALDEHEVVLGPAVDGGYYLLGLTRVVPQLFQASTLLLLTLLLTLLLPLDLSSAGEWRNLDNSAPQTRPTQQRPDHFTALAPDSLPHLSEGQEGQGAGGWGPVLLSCPRHASTQDNMRRRDQSPPRAKSPTQRTTKQKADGQQPEQEQEEQREQQGEQRQEQQHERQQRQGQQHELAERMHNPKGAEQAHPSPALPLPSLLNLAPPPPSPAPPPPSPAPPPPNPAPPPPSLALPLPAQPCPTPSQPCSIPSQPGPTPSQPGPTPSQPCPTPSQPCVAPPSPAQPGPTPSQPCPTPSHSCPTPSQPCVDPPLPAQPCPTPSQPCPTPSQPCVAPPCPALPHPLPARPHNIPARPHSLPALPHHIPALRCPSQPGPARPHPLPALPHPLPALRCPSQPGPARPHPIPALRCSSLACPALPCPALPYLALPYPACMCVAVQAAAAAGCRCVAVHELRQQQQAVMHDQQCKDSNMC
ncbi:hypothetical protein QJQ45_023936, partial [Haematococcus lacustris]